jgi:hypothetical protein
MTRKEKLKLIKKSRLIPGLYTRKEKLKLIKKYQEYVKVLS